MRSRFSLRLSPFTSFSFSQARKHNWPEYSLWDHGPTCIVGQVICLGPRSHLNRRSGYLAGTTVPPVSSVSLSAWDHGPTCVVGQVICLGPRSHLHRRSGYLAGTTVPPVSSVSLSAWDHGPTCIVCQLICLGPRSHLHRRSGYLAGTTVPPASSVRLSGWDHGPTFIDGTLLVWEYGSINASHEQVLACRRQPVERNINEAGRLSQAMVKALFGSERSMLGEICKISRGVRLNF